MDGPSTQTTDRGTETRRHILDVAAAAFAERGFAGTSLNDLIRDTGLTKGGFYFHFPSKEALALAVIRYKNERWIATAQAATEGARSSIEKLSTLALAIVELHEEDGSMRAMSRLCLELGEENNVLALSKPFFDGWERSVAGIVRDGQAAGEIAQSASPDDIASVAVSAFIGMEEMSDKAGFGLLRERVEALCRVLARALTP